MTNGPVRKIMVYPLPGFLFKEFKMKKEQKSEMVHFRCSQSEKKIIQKAAQSVGATESVYLRTAALLQAERLGDGDRGQKSATITR
jgi:hypothetical protein